MIICGKISELLISCRHLIVEGFILDRFLLVHVYCNHLVNYFQESEMLVSSSVHKALSHLLTNPSALAPFDTRPLTKVSHMFT